MPILHAIWNDGTLHLWGELPAPADTPTRNAQATRDAEPGIDADVREGGSIAGSSDATATSTGTRPYPRSVDAASLRHEVGDVFDALLVSGARDSTVTLWLPCQDDQPLPSPAAARENARAAHVAETTVLRPFLIATLAFAPADAMDLLASEPSTARDRIRPGESFRFWSKAAGLVLELLARQHYVPDLHRVDDTRFRGFWRPVIDDAALSQRIRGLIQTMPPVCRAFRVNLPVQAAALVEDFLLTTVDALVRRCLEGDELAHAVLERSGVSDSPMIHWLGSLVSEAPQLEAPMEAQREAFDAVRAWLSRLEPGAGARAFRTCFHLHDPPDDADSSERNWRLTIHAQDRQNEDRVVDAAQLTGEGSNEQPRILPRPFDNAIEGIREDLARAAKHFPPLAVCAERDGPVECRLSVSEAYAFLRDAVPLLTLEDFGVWVPAWWKEDRPRLRMWLHLDTPDGRIAEDAPLGLETVVRFDWRAAIGDDDLTTDEMEKLAASKDSLLRVHGRWTEIQPSEATTAVRFMTEAREPTMTLFEALRQCYVADDLDTGITVAGLRASGRLKTLLDPSSQAAMLHDATPPREFHGTLRPYQLRGVAWLRFLSELGLGACLADDMGLGKTIQLIALLLAEREGDKRCGPTLLVVPMSLVGNWVREIERFGPGLSVMVHHGTERLTGRQFLAEVAKYDMVISTYGLIHRDFRHLAGVEWHRVALDEAQNIKNPAAKQAVAIRSLRAVQRVALTGTPVENRLSELWSIIDFLNPGYLGSAGEFRRRFAVPVERHHDSDRAGRLRHLIRPFLLRRLKNDPNVEVDLPEKMEMKVYCNLTREQAALYKATVDEMLGRVDHAEGIRRRGMILATLVKLKQICNHPAHFLGDQSDLPHRSGKCDRLVEMLDEALAEGDRALIFTQFRQMGELLRTLLGNVFDKDILFFHGGTTRKGRDDIVMRFQTESPAHPILILSLKAGGFGLNLTAANHVFHFDRWWNPAVEQQATDRAYRIGQHRRVQVHKFLCVGTLEEHVDALLEKKKNLADSVVGSGEEWLTELSTEKLREMLQLSRDAVAEP